MNNEEGAMPVRQFTTKRLLAVEISKSITEACGIMVEFGISSLVIVTDGKVVGFVTQGDIIKRVVAPGLDYNEPVEKIMTRDLITVDINAPVEEAITLMEKHQIKHMLVRENGDIVGIFTFKDFHDPRKQCLETSISSE